MDVIDFPVRPRPVRALTDEQKWEEIELRYAEVQRLLHEVKNYGRNEQRAVNFLRYRFNLSSHNEMTLAQMRKAIPILRETVVRCAEFDARMREVAKTLDEEVVGHGAPWTPAIKRRLRARGVRRLEKRPNWTQLADALESELREATAGR